MFSPMYAGRSDGLPRTKSKAGVSARIATMQARAAGLSERRSAREIIAGTRKALAWYIVIPVGAGARARKTARRARP